VTFWQSRSAASATRWTATIRGIFCERAAARVPAACRALLIVPVFRLCANAGVDLRGGLLAEAFARPVTWVVQSSGLVLGKLLGIGLITLADSPPRTGRPAVGVGWEACSVVRRCPGSVFHRVAASSGLRFGNDL